MKPLLLLALAANVGVGIVWWKMGSVSGMLFSAFMVGIVVGTIYLTWRTL